MLLVAIIFSFCYSYFDFVNDIFILFTELATHKVFVCFNAV